VYRYWRPIVEVIEGLGNVIFYPMAFLILVFPPLVWVHGALVGRTGWVWVGAALLFALVVPVTVELLAVSVNEVMGKIKNGELFPSIFQPLRSLSGVLGILGIFKLENALIHGTPGAGETSWPRLIWEFTTGF